MKSKSTAILLALLLGGLGIHRFYLDRPISGFFYLIFCWTFIPSLIGFLEAISFMSYNEAGWDKKYNKEKAIAASIREEMKAGSAVDALKNLGALRESGVLTESEFQDKKEILLKKIS